MKSLRDEIRTEVRDKEDGFNFIASKANDFIRDLPGFHRAAGAISLFVIRALITEKSTRKRAFFNEVALRANEGMKTLR